MAVVLDENELEHLFHTTMIRSYTWSRLSVRNLLNSTDYPAPAWTSLMKIFGNDRETIFEESRKREYERIVKKGCIKPVYRSELPENTNFVENRFFIAIKEPDTANPAYKARCILLVHQDLFWHSIAYDSPMLMHMILRVILSISVALFNLTLWNRDVGQVYIQSNPLQLDMFTEPSSEENLASDTVLKVKLTHYGLIEAISFYSIPTIQCYS